MDHRIPIFYYHSVGGKPPETLALNDFKLHLEALKAGSFKTITLLEALTGHYDALEKNVVLSFDDGLLDNYEQAWPLLMDHGFVATFFVVPGFDHLTRWVHPKRCKWSDREQIGYTIPYSNMQKHHRQALLDAGMEIGSHGFTHQKLNQIDRACLAHEIVDSKKHLEDELGVPIETFCYPNGRYDPVVLKAVKEAGYLGATTTWPGYFNPNRSLFKINRFLVENPFFFIDVLEGRGLSPWAYSKSAVRKSAATGP